MMHMMYMGMQMGNWVCPFLSCLFADIRLFLFAPTKEFCFDEDANSMDFLSSERPNGNQAPTLLWVFGNIFGHFELLRGSDFSTPDTFSYATTC